MSNAASAFHANQNKRLLLTELHLEPVVRKRLIHERLRRRLIHNRRHRVHPAQKRKRTRQIRRRAILSHNVRRHVIQRRLRVRIPGVPRQLRLIRNLRTQRVSSFLVSHRVSHPSRASFVRRSNRITHSVGRSNEKSQRALMRTSAAGAVVGSTAGPMPARDVDEVVIPRPVVLRTAVVATRRSIVVQAQLWRSNDSNVAHRCPNTTIEA